MAHLSLQALLTWQQNGARVGGSKPSRQLHGLSPACLSQVGDGDGWGSWLVDGDTLVLQVEDRPLNT